MDSQLIAIVVGGGLTLSGNILANYITSRKEQEQWKRLQESEERKWARDEQHRHRQELYDIYRNCLYYLSLIIAECRLNPGEKKLTDEIYSDESGEHQVAVYIRKSISENEKLYRQEAHKWLWLLLLHLRGIKRAGIAQFEYDLKFFVEGFSSHLSENLRQHVLDLAKGDNRLQPLAEDSELKDVI